MALECLLLTRDPCLLETIRSKLGAVGIELHFRKDARGAVETCARRHLDGFIIDCDDTPGGTEALTKIRNSPSNKFSMIFAVVNGPITVHPALDLGANFVLKKPVEEARLQSFLEIALSKMEREHRRYLRFQVNLPVELRFHTGGTVTGKMTNVSEGGLAVSVMKPVSREAAVTVEFQLPSVQPHRFKAKADVAWADAFAMGLRLLYIEPECRSSFAAWLNSLESQSRFRVPAQPSRR